MSFDTDPRDKYERILVYHSESDCLFVVTSRAEFEQMCNGEPCDDVTDIEKFETRYKREQDGKKGEGTY